MHEKFTYEGIEVTLRMSFGYPVAEFINGKTTVEVEGPYKYRGTTKTDFVERVCRQIDVLLWIDRSFNQPQRAG